MQLKINKPDNQKLNYVKDKMLISLIKHNTISPFDAIYAIIMNQSD